MYIFRFSKILHRNISVSWILISTNSTFLFSKLFPKYICVYNFHWINKVPFLFVNSIAKNSDRQSTIAITYISCSRLKNCNVTFENSISCYFIVFNLNENQIRQYCIRHSGIFYFTFVHFSLYKSSGNVNFNQYIYFQHRHLAVSIE